ERSRRNLAARGRALDHAIGSGPRRPFSGGIGRSSHLDSRTLRRDRTRRRGDGRTVEPLAEPAMIDRLSARLPRLASGRHALRALVLVAFAEAWFFPLPADLLLIPMILARPRRAFLYAAAATVASVAGGFLGYAIGDMLFAAVGRPMLEFYQATGQYEALRAGFAPLGV